MEWYIQFAIVTAGILALLALRMPLGFVFGVVGTAGIVVYAGQSFCLAVAQQMHDMLSDFVLITIPLFVLMAEVLSAAGFIPDLYNSVEKLAGRMRGSLAVASIMASAMFAMVCGSSYVTAASLGRMIFPEMLTRSYDKKLVAGSIAAGGSLGILIPPSLAFVIYGYMSGASIATLFIAGIVPGLLLAGLFIISILVFVWIFPEKAGTGKAVEWMEKVRSLSKVVPVILLSIVLLICIYLGITTPAEAAAVGTIFSVLLCIAYRRFQWDTFLQALKHTVAVSGFLLLLMCTAKVLSFMMAKAGIMYGLQTILSSLPKWQFILLLYVVITVLGFFLEGTSIIVLTTPIFAPALGAAGFDLVWYGVILVLFIEIALLTPPVGMNCYIVAQIGKPYGINLNDVFIGMLPFLMALFVEVVIVTLVPRVALWLPSTMK